ncbi:MAG: FGGY family carbohydrate kinase [Lapillicoccus sp.]
MTATPAHQERPDALPPAGASRDLVLGIDLGTSSVKAVLTTLDAQVLGQAARTYPVRTPGPGRAESDPEEWREAIIVAVRDVLAQVPQGTVRGIGLSGQMHGVAVTDHAFQPIRPAILWADARATDQIRRYQLLPSDRLASLHNPLTPGMAGPILGWLAQHEPHTAERMRWALQPKDWVRAWLTGRSAAEPSDASATLLYDIPADTWAFDIAEVLRVDTRVLPPLLPASGAAAGTLTPVAAGQLGLEVGTPVAAGGADTAVAALGSGLTQVGAVQLTIGTGVQVITPVGPDVARSTPPWSQVTHLYRTATSSGHYRMAATLNGGLVLDWVRSVLGASWSDLYDTAALPGSPDAPFFLPHLNGERTPYMSTGMRGAWVNLAPQHTRADLLRAALEGVAFGIKEAVQALDPAGPPVKQLRLAGGGSTAPAWRQMLADILEAELNAVDVPAASGRGAAMLGAQAAALLDENELLATLSPTADPVACPLNARVHDYRHRFDQFRDHVQQLNTPSFAGDLQPS